MLTHLHLEAAVLSSKNMPIYYFHRPRRAFSQPFFLKARGKPEEKTACNRGIFATSPSRHCNQHGGLRMPKTLAVASIRQDEATASS